MKKEKKLVCLISAKGKTKEEFKKEVKTALQKYFATQKEAGVNRGTTSE